MSTRAITLVDLPKSLRKGIDRRLPRGSTFKDRTGNQYRYRVVLGFAGFKGRWTAWLTQCKCGNLSVVTYKHLNHKSIPTCAMQLVELPKPLRKGIDRRLPHHASFKNLAGKKYGSRTVLGFAGFRGAHAVWLCRCKCGRLSVIEGAFLRAGLSGSCGCIFRLSPAAKKLEDVYHSIKQRCYDPNCESYQLYGARGIAVCKRWRESIEAFAKDMGPRRSPKHVVVRRNKRGNYTPNNCYWGLMIDAHRERGRTITYNGKTKIMSRWAAELGISREAMRLRVNRCYALIE